MRNRFWSLLQDKRTGRRAKAELIRGGFGSNPSRRCYAAILFFTICFLFGLYLIVSGLIVLLGLC